MWQLSIFPTYIYTFEFIQSVFLMIFLFLKTFNEIFFFTSNQILLSLLYGCPASVPIGSLQVTGHTFKQAPHKAHLSSD